MKLCKLLAIVFSFMFLLSINYVDAKGGSSGGGGGGGRGSFSSSGGGKSYSSSPSVSKPSSPSPSPSTPPSKYSSSGTQSPNPSTPSKYGSSDSAKSSPGNLDISRGGTNVTPGSKNSYASSLNKKVTTEQSKASLSKFETEQSKFKSPPSSYGSYSSSSVYSGTRYNPRNYTYRRDNFYHSYTPPAYVYNSYPRFGMWDGMMMWFMLDNMSNRQYQNMYYNHQNDEGFKQWREEANKLAVDNADLKAKLAVLDNKVKELDGTPIDPNYMPDDVDHDLLLAKDVLDKKEGNIVTEEEEEDGFGFLSIIATIAVIAILGALVSYVVVSRRQARQNRPSRYSL